MPFERVEFENDVAREATRASFNHYRDAWVKDRNLTYQGVNHVAMAAWDGGIFLSANDLKGARAAAGEIFALIEAMPEAERTSWDYATAGEALVGLGRHSEALEWYGRYGQGENSAFALAGTVRQLNQLWRAGEHDWGRLILAPLIGKLGELPGGSFSVSAEVLGGLAEVTQKQHESVLGEIGAHSYSWLQEGFEMAQSVAMIHKNGKPHGTGFVVRGRDLAPDLDDELLVVTNAHVVSDPPLEKAASPDEATVTFEILGRQQVTRRYSVSAIVWQSPPDQHDVSVLRLDAQLPAAVQPLRIASGLPRLQPALRASTSSVIPAVVRSVSRSRTICCSTTSSRSSPTPIVTRPAASTIALPRNMAAPAARSSTRAGALSACIMPADA